MLGIKKFTVVHLNSSIRVCFAVNWTSYSEDTWKTKRGQMSYSICLQKISKGSENYSDVTSQEEGELVDIR